MEASLNGVSKNQFYLNQVLVQELSETDRILHADLELDIREAPLREWELRVPADYVVASVTGQAVADFVLRTK